MLDFIETIMTAAAVAMLLTAVVTTIPVTPTSRFVVAGVFGTWLGFAIAVAAAGKLSAIAWVGLLFASPLVAVAGLALGLRAVRDALLAIPVPLIIGLNAFRVLGAGFLVLASVGRLGGPFPLSAGWGDIIVGVLAIPVALLAVRAPASDARILAWNILGTLDLVTAVVLGIASANGTPIQLIHAGAGSAAMAALPWSLVPTFLVPVYLIGHAIVFAHARAAATVRPRESLRPSL